MRPPFPSDRRFGGDDDQPFPDPFRRWSLGSFGLFLLLISLTVLFVAGIVGYFQYRYFAPDAPPPDTLRIPVGLWVSTGVLVGSAVVMHFAARAATRGAPRAERWLLLAALLLGLIFVALQVPALLRLLGDHDRLSAARGDGAGSGLYGLAFFLILLHALHVIGGLIPLGYLTVQAIRRRLNAYGDRAVRACAAYWHFLDAVWLALFAVFIITA